MGHQWMFRYYLEENELDEILLAADEKNGLKMIEILQKKVKETERDIDPSIYADIAFIYYVEKDIDNAEIFYLKAIAKFNNEEVEGYSSSGFANILVECGRILNEKEKHEKALDVFLKARKIYKAHWYNEEFPDAFQELESKITMLQSILK